MSLSVGAANLLVRFPFALSRTRVYNATHDGKRERKRGNVTVNFGFFGEAVRRDLEFVKNGICRGIQFANEAFRIPQVSKALDDVLWLRHLEDPTAPPLQRLSMPQPSYPELSGVDLFMADIKALEAYAGYLYYLSKVWSKPLPEVYDPQDVADYFNCRPHVVALRLLEVSFAFAFAGIRIRASGIGKFLRSSSDVDMDGSTSQYEFGMVLKETMLGLGPTFIKVGQSLSTRPDIIGTDITKALSELHDRIPPFSRTAAMKIIKEELGSPLESLFSYISEEPVAAASFGQVYYANTLDGSCVAVKVQRPYLRHVVVRDIYILRLGLGLLQKIAKRKNDLRLYADELGKGLIGELDYTLEATNASKFREAHSPFPFIHVPKVFQSLSRKRVLTMEWVVGESPTDLLSLSSSNSVEHGFAHSEQKIEAKRRLLDMVGRGVEASLIQLLETGLLHADPHPGNLRYISAGKIGFLDFGLLCQMEKKHQFAMLASIVYIVNGDWMSLVNALTEMDIVRPGTNIRRVTMELEDELGEVVFKDGIPDIKFSRVLGKIWSIALKYHFRMPPYYTLVLRSLASLEGLAVAADPEFKTFEAAYPYVVRKLLTENTASTRKILHSVALNKKKEFRWERLVLLLRVGSSSRKGIHKLKTNNVASLGYLSDRSNAAGDTAHSVLRLLLSKDGFVLRRLVMTADGASLIRDMVSTNAIAFRQQLSKIIADILYRSMLKGLTVTHQYTPQETLPSEANNTYESILRDRRLKVIFFKVLDSARKDPVLMLKFYWSCFAMFVKATAMACHRTLVCLSEAYLVEPISLTRNRVAANA